jgi:hypothetical protein
VKAAGRVVVRVLAVLVVMAGGLVTATSAAGSAAPTFVSPAEGSTVLGPLVSATIDMHDAPAGRYQLYYAYCADCLGTLSAETTYDPASGTAVTLPVVDALPTDHPAWLTLRGSGVDVRVGLTVTMPPWVSALSGPSAFYPRRKDGYRDKAAYSWQSGYQDSGLAPKDVVEVVDSTGRVLRSEARGDGFFAWDGRDSRGRMTPTGTYTVRVISRNLLGHTVSASKRVRVDAGWVTQDIVKTRAGTRTTRRTTTLGCNAMNRSGELNMWCDSGRAAEAHYDFTIPARARRLRWTIRRRPSVDNPGTVTLSGRRLSPTRYRVGARITGGETLRIVRVQLRYRTRTLR